MREYKIAKGWAIFIYICGPLIIALFGSVFIMPFLPGDDIALEAYWILVPISLAVITIMVIGIRDSMKGKFVIAQDHVYSSSTFYYRKLMLDEIKGYRIADKYIFIEPRDEKKKRIKISTYLGKTEEILEWLSDHYPNLDSVQAEKEKEEILNDEKFGWTPEKRAERLGAAGKAATVLNWTGVGIAIWTLLFPVPYEYAMVTSIVFPVICIGVLKYFNGLIRINAEERDSPYPKIVTALFSTWFALCIRVMLDYSIFDHSNSWTPSILMALTLLAVILIGNAEFDFKKAKDYLAISFLSLLLFVYSYSSVVGLNCLFDTSQPEIHHAKILSKRISSGKSTSYYLELTPWGPQQTTEETDVPRELYEKLNENDEVTIYFMKGEFNIPWFFVTE